MVAVVVADIGDLGGVGFLGEDEGYVDGVGFDLLDGSRGEDGEEEEEG